MVPPESQINMKELNMLQEWIREVQTNTNDYCIETWKYRLAGNVLEFSVLPQCTKNRDQYRCSVITIGQILKNLGSRIEEQESHYLIQSFPSIENPEIIASIRMDDNSYYKSPSFTPFIFDKYQYTPEEWMGHLAGKYQLGLQKISTPATLSILKDTKKTFNWLALTSVFDNPFSWLNVGYWKESVLQDVTLKFHETGIKFFDFCDNRKEIKSEINLPDGFFLQAILAFE